MEIANAFRASVAAAIAAEAGVAVDPAAIKAPARRAEASWRVPDGICAEELAAALTQGTFLPVLGAPPVGRVEQENGWLLFFLSDAFCFACVEAVNASLPLPPSDCGVYALNRMLFFKDKPGGGCPERPRMRRALWLCLLLFERPGLFREAERALLTVMHDVPPRDRPALWNASGALSGAAARLLFRAIRLQTIPSQSIKEGTP